MELTNETVVEHQDTFSTDSFEFENDNLSSEFENDNLSSEFENNNLSSPSNSFEFEQTNYENFPELEDVNVNFMTTNELPKFHEDIIDESKLNELEKILFNFN